MKVLILGGNRFFGRRLAEKILQSGHELTLLNRGNTDDGLGEQVSRIKCDRTDEEALRKAVWDFEWDVVYDQVCFDFEQAQSACEVFKNKVGRFIFTSSQSVYEPGQNIKESTFDPNSYEFTEMTSSSQDYAEAKRQAEVGFAKYAEFPVVSLRLPIVVGPDDYTERLQFHINRIKAKKEIYFPNLSARLSLVTSDFAAIALHHLATSNLVGPINAANEGPIALDLLMQKIAEYCGGEFKLAEENTAEDHSPYGIGDDWFMNLKRLTETGLNPPDLSAEIDTLLTELK